MRPAYFPTRPPGGIQFQRLSDFQNQQIYWACLEILESTGVHLHDAEARTLLKKAGATISEDLHVRLSPSLVEKALITAPRKITLYNRHHEPVMPVTGYQTFFGPGSDCLHILDHRTNTRRSPHLTDIIDASRVIDALPRIDFAMSMFVPDDCPAEIVDRYQMEIMLNYTSKPIVFVTSDLAGCKDAVQMAEIVAGGPQTLSLHPTIACYINVTTGLVHNQEALQKLLYLAEKGIPFAYVPSTQGGVTAPVTPASALAISQAGALVGLVLSQLKREGTPFIMPGWGGNMLDMRTTVQPYADPDKRALAPDFVHSLGLPMFALAGCSDSKTLDQQAGIEAALTLMTDYLCGANIIHDLGYLESGLTASLAQLAICNEILQWLDHFSQPLAVDSNALALDAIKATGPGGQYLDHPHTLKHFRERFYPQLFDRQNFASWAEKGSLTLAERASAKINHILETHPPEPLPKDIQERLHAVITRAKS